MKDRLGHFLETWRLRTVLPHVRGRLLDIGCGMNRLVRAYGLGTGVDVHQWGDVDVLIEDAARLPFGDGEFETATVIAALNHIPNRREALREIRRVLRPGGTLITTMIPPRISRVWHGLRKPWDADQTERGMKPGEVYGLRAAEMAALLVEAGFTVRSQTRFMWGLNCMTIADRAPDPAAPPPSGPGQPPGRAGETGATQAAR